MTGTTRTATDDPFARLRGDTVTLTLRAQGDELTVSVDGQPITGMNPFVDPDPLLGLGRVGVGQETNPTMTTSSCERSWSQPSLRGSSVPTRSSGLWERFVD